MSVLRTLDHCFEGLPGYSFSPLYAHVPGISVEQPLCLHDLDEGPGEAAPVVMLHGEPRGLICIDT